MSLYFPALRCLSGLVVVPSRLACSYTRSTVPPSRKHDFCTARASSIRNPQPRISQTVNGCLMPPASVTSCACKGNTKSSWSPLLPLSGSTIPPQRCIVIFPATTASSRTPVISARAIFLRELLPSPSRTVSRSITSSRACATAANVRSLSAGPTCERRMLWYASLVESVPACRLIHFSHSSPNLVFPSLGSMNTRARLSWAILSCASWASLLPLPYLGRPVASSSSAKLSSRCRPSAQYRNVHLWPQVACFSHLHFLRMVP